MRMCLLYYGPRHAKTCLWVYADSEGPDQPAHLRSLIRAFTVRKQNHWILQNGEHKSEWCFAHVQYDLNPHILRIFEGTLSLDVAHMLLYLEQSQDCHIYWDNTHCSDIFRHYQPVVSSDCVAQSPLSIWLTRNLLLKYWLAQGQTIPRSETKPWIPLHVDSSPRLLLQPEIIKRETF